MPTTKNNDWGAFLDIEFEYIDLDSSLREKFPTLEDKEKEFKKSIHDYVFQIQTQYINDSIASDIKALFHYITGQNVELADLMKKIKWLAFRLARENKKELVLWGIQTLIDVFTDKYKEVEERFFPEIVRITFLPAALAHDREEFQFYSNPIVNFVDKNYKAIHLIKSTLIYCAAMFEKPFIIEWLLSEPTSLIEYFKNPDNKNLNHIRHGCDFLRALNVAISSEKSSQWWAILLNNDQKLWLFLQLTREFLLAIFLNAAYSSEELKESKEAFSVLIQSSSVEEKQNALIIAHSVYQTLSYTQLNILFKHLQLKDIETLKFVNDTTVVDWMEKNPILRVLFYTLYIQNSPDNSIAFVLKQLKINPEHLTVENTEDSTEEKTAKKVSSQNPQIINDKIKEEVQVTFSFKL